MRIQYKKLTYEDKFARKYYCNSDRFISKIKKNNRKKLRRIIKKEVIQAVEEGHFMA